MTSLSQPWILEHLRCPKTGARLTEQNGQLLGGARPYPIVNGIPRFVDSHYAGGFGLQWNKHDLTQIDTTQHAHSAQRFWGETGFTPEYLKGKLVLDGGCGAGRFTDIAARAGARMVAVDLSEAVEACAKTTAGLDVAVVQASLLELPFEPGTFDAAFTIGVIQHTPDPLRSLANIARTVKPGGQMGVSWYKRYWYTFLHQKYILRWLLRPYLWGDERLYRVVSWYVPKLLPISRVLNKAVPASVLDRVLPVANRDWVQGLTEAEKREWAVLDTYDWFNARYDQPQRWRDVEATMRRAGFQCERAPARRAGLHCVQGG